MLLFIFCRTFQFNTSCKEIDDNFFDLVVVALGAVSLLTPHGLIAFSDFVFNWFNATDSVIHHRSKRFGNHLSDMKLQMLFMEVNETTRNSCYELWGSGEVSLAQLSCVITLVYAVYTVYLFLHIYLLNSYLLFLNLFFDLFLISRHSGYSVYSLISTTRLGKRNLVMNVC